jgi:hypothetical protein
MTPGEQLDVFVWGVVSGFVLVDLVRIVALWHQERRQ